MTPKEIAHEKQRAAVQMALRLRTWLSESGFRDAADALYATSNFDFNGEAAKMFPPPKVTRPRVVAAVGNLGLPVEYRVVDGCIEGRDVAGEWGNRRLTPSQTLAIHSVLSNPTEEVDEC